jgi:transketolase
MHTIKPLDTEAIIQSIRKTKCAVTAEEHNIIGGLGDAIAPMCIQEFPGTDRIRWHKRYIWRKW